MTQVRKPRFDLVPRDDLTGLFTSSRDLCACYNLATHQLVNYGHPLPADEVVELLFHPQEVLAEMSEGKQPINCCVWCGWDFLNCYSSSCYADRLRFWTQQQLRLDYEAASTTPRKASR